MGEPRSTASRDEAPIVAAEESPYTRMPSERQTTSWLLADVARRALESAGLHPSEIDGLGVASFPLAPDRAVDLAFRLGLRLRWLMDSGVGGASAIDLLQHARTAVEAGDASNVLLLAGDRLEPSDFAGLVDSFNVATQEHLAGIPTGGPNALFAMLTERQMERLGLGRETYGQLVVAQRAWARLNPGALFRGPLTLDEYLAGPIVAAPLSRFDCPPVVAGANAVLISNRPRSSHGAVRVRGLVALHNRDSQDRDGLATGLSECQARLWDEAEAGPSDIDVASLYDDYPAIVVAQLNDLGFAENGIERFVADQISSRQFPLNTSGGQLCAGQAGAAGGMHGLVEVVHQLRGQAGDRQIPGARLGLATGYGMVAYRYGACANAAVFQAVQ